MFSRTGKFTTSMYMVFNQKKRSVDPSPRPQDHLDDEDIGLLLGNKNISIQD
jgi:carbamate kinase